MKQTDKQPKAEYLLDDGSVLAEFSLYRKMSITR